MQKIKLYGHLAKEFGDEFEFSVATAGEAIRALAVNFPTFLKALKEGSYEVIRGERDEAKGIWLGIEDINEFKLGQADLHLVPVVEGSKNGGGVLKIVLGVALIGAAIFFSGGALAAPLGTGLLSGLTYGNIAMFGLALMIAGVSTLLTPKQKPKNEGKNEQSFSLSGPGNAYDQGNPIPIVYGEVICGSQLISGGIDIEDIAIGYDPTRGNTLIGTYNPATGQGVQTGTVASYTEPSGNT